MPKTGRKNIYIQEGKEWKLSLPVRVNLTKEEAIKLISKIVHRKGINPKSRAELVSLMKHELTLIGRGEEECIKQAKTFYEEFFGDHPSGNNKEEFDKNDTCDCGEHPNNCVCDKESE